MTATALKTKKNMKTVETGHTRSGATAIHGTDGDDHVVGIGNLRVIVCKEGDLWFAQGLEINYAADGTSLKAVKQNFEHGLATTVGLHLQVFNSIENLLVPAPAHIWKELTEVKKHFRFSQVSVHEFDAEDEGSERLQELPYTGISYLERANEAAA